MDDALTATMRRVPLRLIPPVDHSAEPGFREWKATTFGECAVCGARGRLIRHHVVLAQHVREIDPALVWDLRNSLKLGAHCRCHSAHHQAARRISIRHVPDQAIDFAVELFGPAAGGYLSRYYAP